MTKKDNHDAYASPEQSNIEAYLNFCKKRLFGIDMLCSILFTLIGTICSALIILPLYQTPPPTNRTDISDNLYLTRTVNLSAVDVLYFGYHSYGQKVAPSKFQILCNSPAYPTLSHLNLRYIPHTTPLKFCLHQHMDFFVLDFWNVKYDSGRDLDLLYHTWI